MQVFLTSCNANDDFHEKINHVNLEAKPRSTCAREVKTRLTVNFGTDCFNLFVRGICSHSLQKSFCFWVPGISNGAGNTFNRAGPNYHNVKVSTLLSKARMTILRQRGVGVT